jgi:hypothetical protein
MTVASSEAQSHIPVFYPGPVFARAGLHLLVAGFSIDQ